MPKIGITMGDACGIGSEVIVKALSNSEIYKICSPVVIGNSRIMKDAVKIAKSGLHIRPISQIKMAEPEYGVIELLELEEPIIEANLPYGEINRSAGEAAVRYIKTAVQLALNNEIDAVTTAPINKAAIHLAGYSYPGHTELLAKLTNSEDPVMMLAGKTLRVVYTTTHAAIADVPKLISTNRILKVIQTTGETLIKLGISEPEISVSALNPHASELGAFGDEEARIITPAIEKARSLGWNVEGPLPADTLFVKAKDGCYDAVVVMYHDQGNIPLKLLEFGQVVNVTLGLPIIRTSVDHGTAFDIAGRGVADERSMVAAIKSAAKLAGKLLKERK